MQIQIQLSQQDIETAIRDYLAKVGMNSPVDTVNFSVPRGSKDGIKAQIDLAPEGTAQDSTPSKPEPEPKTPTRTKSDKVESTAPAADTGKKVGDSTPDPEPVKDEDEPPFTPDAKTETAKGKDTESANDSTETEPTKESRKLFG